MGGMKMSRIGLLPVLGAVLSLLFLSGCVRSKFGEMPKEFMFTIPKTGAKKPVEPVVKKPADPVVKPADPVVEPDPPPVKKPGELVVDPVVPDPVKPTLVRRAGTQFYRELFGKKACINQDGLQIVEAFVFGGTGPGGEGEPIGLQALQENGILEASEAEAIVAGDRLRADVFAYWLCRALGLKGGLTARIFGLGPRSAYRECVNLKLIRASGQGRTLSGQDLLSIMARAEDFHRRMKEE